MHLSQFAFTALALPIGSLAATPSPLINSPLIYDKYVRATNTYRPNSYPHLTTASGAWSWVGADWWTSGFLPGSLYLLNERKNLCPGKTSVDWLRHARKWSEGVLPLQYGNSQGHDQGFLSFPFVEELKINPNNQTAIAAVKNFAQLLTNRFSWTVGCSRSWDGPNFQVIIDNMINLEIFFQAVDLGLPSWWRDMAQSHAYKTLENQLRADGSHFHVIEYNENTGAVLTRHTAQGYADWSTWTRGQAWGIYGFAMMFQRNGDINHLITSRKMGKLFIDRLASSPATLFGVPPWDFDAPAPASADTSAAALASTAFLTLGSIEASRGNSTGAAYWRDNAITLLSNTAEHYFARETTWDSILKNGTSHHPNNVRNTGLVYGDYYFIKAGNLLIQQGLLAC